MVVVITLSVKAIIDWALALSLFGIKHQMKESERGVNLSVRVRSEEIQQNMIIDLDKEKKSQKKEKRKREWGDKTIKYMR